MNTVQGEKGGIYSSITVNGVTYTSDNSKWNFFIVGGSADGDTGRVYIWYGSDPTSSSTSANSLNAWSPTTSLSFWNRSVWVSDTLLTTTGVNFAMDNNSAAHFGLTSLSDFATLGFDGSILFDKVVIDDS